MHNSRFVFQFVLFLSLCVAGLTSSAQELGLSRPDKSAVLKFAAIVQYVEGRAVDSEPSTAQTDVVYQTVVYEGDRLDTTRGSVVKLALRSGCILILRGEGAAAAPTEKKPWRFRAESARLICRGSHQAETFGVANAPVVLKDGELLFLSNPSRVMLLRGSAQVHGQNLELRKLYSMAQNVSEVSPQPNETALRDLNLREKPPRESEPWPEIAKPATFRAIFGPTFGGDRVIYDTDSLSEKGLSGDGPKLQFHFRTGDDHSFIVSFVSRQTQNKDHQGSPNGPPPQGVSSKLELMLLELGYRPHFDRWWSPYFKLGGGRVKDTIYINQQNQGSSYSYLFYAVSAAAGVDAHILPKLVSPFGVYGAVEAQAIQSLWRDPAQVPEGGGGGSQGGDQPYRLTSLNLTLNLGLELQF